MATVPGQLIWEIMKKINSFLVKEFGNATAKVQLAERATISTTATPSSIQKTVTIQAEKKDTSVLLATTKTKKQNKSAALFHKCAFKKEFSRMSGAVSSQVANNYYRPDLEKAALARLSAVHRSLKVAKSGVKKRNRQA